MKYKIVRNERSFEDQYFILYKKSWFSRWRYVKNSFGLLSYWNTEKSAEIFIEQQQKNLK